MSAKNARTMGVVLSVLVASGCYASHGPAGARVDGLSVEGGWMAGDFGEIRDVASAAYEIEVVDSRPEGEARVNLLMHSGARGGDAHAWAMIGIGLREMSLDEAGLPAGAPRRFFGVDTSGPGVELWACSGPAQAVPVFEANAIVFDLEVMPGASADVREVVFDADLPGDQRVRGGFTLRRVR